MGLTFQQKFYYVPEEVYLIYDGKEMINSRPIAIIQKPEDYEQGRKLESLLITKGYILQVCNFDELIINGYELLDNMGVDNRYGNFGIN